MTILLPTNLPRRIKSPKLVHMFLETNNTKMIVDTTQTGRDKFNVYASLKQYVDRHPEFGVGVQLEDGDIILYRNTE